MKIHEFLAEAVVPENKLHDLARELDSHHIVTLLAYWYLHHAQQQMESKVRRPPHLYRKDPNDPYDMPLTCTADDVAEQAVNSAYEDVHDGQLLSKVEKAIHSVRHGFGCEVD